MNDIEVEIMVLLLLPIKNRQSLELTIHTTF